MGGALRGPDAAAAAADTMCQGEGWEAGLPEDDPWTSRSTEVSVESPGGEEGLREAAGEQEWVRQRQRQRQRGDNCQDGGRRRQNCQKEDSGLSSNVNVTPAGSSPPSITEPPHRGRTLSAGRRGSGGGGFCSS